MTARIRILAADDDRITRRLLAVNLERWGFDPVLAGDGLEAWEMLQDENAPEIVVLDWVMPGMDGIEVCRALRKQNDRAYRYVILLAPKAQKNDVLAAFEAGADDHIAKPLNLRDLEERLTAAVKSLESRRRHAVQPTRPGDDAFEPAAEVTRVEPESPTQATLAGKVVGGKYRVVQPIASGGMGSVWEGTHVTLGTRVAIKFIRLEYARDHDSLARFETEARVMARLQSRYAVHVYDFGVTPGGLPYLVMEYLEGRSLTEVVDRDGPLSLPEVASVISQAAHALDKAHKAGVIHRDVKPDNIMLIPDEEAEDDDTAPRNHVKLVDFGVAKVLLEQEPDLAVTADLTPTSLRRPTARGVLLGTPAFMSPEQLLASGVADKYADLWGLAVCAYVAATGKLPYDASTLGDLVKQVCLNPPPPPSRHNAALPAAFDAWFARACASAPKDRFQSGYEFAKELQAACGYVRNSMFSVYPTPLPAMAQGHTADPFTPPMGVAAVRAASQPDPLRRSDPRPTRAFVPRPPRAPSSDPPADAQGDLHPALGSPGDRDSFPHSSTPARHAMRAPPVDPASDPDVTVQSSAHSAQLVARAVSIAPTSGRTTRRVAAPSSASGWAVRVAVVLVLCVIAFALGSRFN